jgi:ribosomal protein L37E
MTSYELTQTDCEKCGQKGVNGMLFVENKEHLEAYKKEFSFCRKCGNPTSVKIF